MKALQKTDSEWLVWLSDFTRENPAMKLELSLDFFTLCKMGEMANFMRLAIKIENTKINCSNRVLCVSQCFVYADVWAQLGK